MDSRPGIIIYVTSHSLNRLFLSYNISFSFNIDNFMSIFVFKMVGSEYASLNRLFLSYNISFCYDIDHFISVFFYNVVGLEYTSLNRLFLCYFLFDNIDHFISVFVYKMVRSEYASLDRLFLSYNISFLTTLITSFRSSFIRWLDQNMPHLTVSFFLIIFPFWQHWSLHFSLRL